MSHYSHPAFAPYRDLLDRLSIDDSLQQANELARQQKITHSGNGQILQFVACSKTSAAEYECSIAATGEVPTREHNLHDFFNMLVWLRFPHIKSVLNMRHAGIISQQPDESRQRGKLRDQLTLLDENGLIVSSGNGKLLNMLRDKQWVELFWENREQVRNGVHFTVIGHGLLERCLAPFPGLTAKCLFLHAKLSSLEETGLAVAEKLAAEAISLPPLPIMGIPGWADNDSLDTYLDKEIFRPPRTPAG